MRWFLFLSACLFIACKKDNASTRIPDGVWVDKAYPLDTIITYRENGKNILFDNSALYRSVRSRLSNDDSYKWKYKLSPGKIHLMFYSQSSQDYFTHDFVWVTEGKEFSMTANAIRLYLSSIGTKLVYEKVK